MANKFKVGDIVRVKTFEELKKDFNLAYDIDYYKDNDYVFKDGACRFTAGMLECCGDFGKIIQVDNTEWGIRYIISICDHYRFTENMLVKLPSIDEVEPATIDDDFYATSEIPNFVEKNCFKVYREEEKEMEDIKLLNVYKDRAITHLRELYDEVFENIKNSNEFIAKFRAITDVYNNACKELFESQHREEPDLDIYPIRKNNYGNGCDYVIDDEYLDRIDEELIEKYEKLRKEFTDNISECRMQIKLVQQTSNSYEDITKILKLYGIIDNNGKVVTYEPVNKKDTIKDGPVKETFKPKRKYNKKQKVNENNN